MIRLAKLEDLPQVLNLYRELRPHDPELEKSFSEQVWAEMMRCPETHIVVADIEGELAATCALGLNKSIANGGRPFAIIEHVITAEKFRRRGLSQQVLEFGIQTAWELNCYKVMLLSGEQLTGAHRVYESAGFKAGIEKGFVIKAPNNKQR